VRLFSPKMKQTNKQKEVLQCSMMPLGVERREIEKIFGVTYFSVVPGCMNHYALKTCLRQEGWLKW
jgi:hypothetical protein